MGEEVADELQPKQIHCHQSLYRKEKECLPVILHIRWTVAWGGWQQQVPRSNIYRRHTLVKAHLGHSYQGQPFSWFPAIKATTYEPRQANLCLRAFRHDKFSLRMPSHSEGPGIWLSVRRFHLDSLLVWASSEGSGETARMRRLARTFAARIGNKYQIRLTRSIYYSCTTSFGVCISCMGLPSPVRHQDTGPSSTPCRQIRV